MGSKHENVSRGSAVVIARLWNNLDCIYVIEAQFRLPFRRSGSLASIPRIQSWIQFSLISISIKIIDVVL